MAFTASHYLEVARIIRNAFEDERAQPSTTRFEAIANIQRDLAGMFKRQNPHFDAVRFAQDCKPKGERSNG